MTKERLEEIRTAYRKGWQGFDDITMVGELITALEEAWNKNAILLDLIDAIVAV